MTHLPLAHQIVQRAHDLFHGRQTVPGVQEVEVDVVGLQSLERRFRDFTNMLRPAV